MLEVIQFMFTHIDYNLLTYECFYLKKQHVGINVMITIIQSAILSKTKNHNNLILFIMQNYI
jgi:hypothetical protein